MHTKINPTKITLLLLFILVGTPLLAGLTRKEKAELREKSAASRKEFVLKIARNIHFESTDGNETYRIGVFGKDEAAKELYSRLKQDRKQITIRGKSVEVFLFKRMSAVKDVDLVYVNGQTRMSSRELDDRIDQDYLMVTEDFPYGQSVINFTLGSDQQVIYTIEDEILAKQGAIIAPSLLSSGKRVRSQRKWEEELQEAVAIIEEQEQMIEGQSETIDRKEQEIQSKADTIQDQSQTIRQTQDELTEREQFIRYQQTIIIVTIEAVLLVSILVVFLFRLNKQRKKALEENERKTADILASITYAERIQKGALPSEELFRKNFSEAFIWYRPKDIVSGDFYWLEIKDDVIYFAVADCTGHGVPGAMLSVLCSNTLSKVVQELSIQQPAKILDKTTQLLEDFFSKGEQEVYDGMDVALCAFDPKTKRLEYAGANRPLFYTREGELQEIKPTRQPIGRYDNRKPYANHDVQLQSGDMIYLFSDGIVDQFGGEKGKKFSTRRLKELLKSIHPKSSEEQRSVLSTQFAEWSSGQEVIDDNCILGARV